MWRLANTLRRLPETHFRAAMGFAGTAKLIEEGANELAVTRMPIRQALKRRANSLMAVAGRVRRIEEGQTVFQGTPYNRT